MIPQLEFGTVSNPEEAPSLGKIICQCFNFPAERWQLFSSRIGLENFRVVRKVGQVVAGLGMYQIGQWFGGCSVPMVGIAAVGVTPEHRGTGVAAFLLTETLKELYANGVPLSALYAATSALYRQVGYEQAGNACIFALLNKQYYVKRSQPANLSSRTYPPQSFSRPLPPTSGYN